MKFKDLTFKERMAIRRKAREDFERPFREIGNVIFNMIIYTSLAITVCCVLAGAGPR